MGKLTISHRATAYPCSVPGLGRLAGAGRIGLTRRKSRNIFGITYYYPSPEAIYIHYICRTREKPFKWNRL